MKIRWVLLPLLFLQCHLFSLLPPLAQSLAELRALLEDKRVYGMLGGSEIIEDIIRTDEGYVIVTRSKILPVDITYLKQEHIGPQQFEFYFHPVIED